MIKQLFCFSKHFMLRSLADEWVFSVIPYLRVYHVENYVIHHHVVLHGGSRCKNADLKINFVFFKEAEVRYKRKTHSRPVVRGGRSFAGNQASESCAWCQQVIYLFAPPDSGCFPLAFYRNWGELLGGSAASCDSQPLMCPVDNSQDMVSDDELFVH